MTRLGGPNFHEIPINRPVSPLHNNQRDGLMRQTINLGRAAYHPNTIGGGCPVQAGRAMGGFVTHAQALDGQKVRERGEKFFDHFSQATLFWSSQSGALSMANTVKDTVKTRKVAILAADGVDGAGVTSLQRSLTAAGAIPKIVAPRGGTLAAADGGDIPVDFSLLTVGSVLFDAVFVPGGAEGTKALEARTEARSCSSGRRTSTARRSAGAAPGSPCCAPPASTTPWARARSS
ncbi:MAG: DJ-1/PfpI family protein [Candidatus Rokuibacteriota bacterium]